MYNGHCPGSPHLLTIVVPVPWLLSCPILSPLPHHLAPTIHPVSSCSWPWLGCCLSIISSSCPVDMVIVVIIVVVVAVVVVVLVVAVVVVPVSRPCPHSYAPHSHPMSSGSWQWFWVLLWGVVPAVVMV